MRRHCQDSTHRRYADGRCGTCNRANAARNRTARGGPPPVYDHTRRILDPNPIRVLAFSTKHAASMWSATHDVSDEAGARAAYRLWSMDAITIQQADSWCICLGYHLVNVYPELYVDETGAAV